MSRLEKIGNGYLIPSEFTIKKGIWLEDNTGNRTGAIYTKLDSSEYKRKNI